MPLRLTLKSTLTVSLLAGALLPLVLAGVVFLRFISDTLKKEISERNFLAAKTMAGEVNRFLEDYRVALEHTADQLNHQAASSGRPAGVDLGLMIKHHRLLESLKVLDGQGRIETFEPFEPHLVGMDLSGHPFIQQAMTSGKPVWSGVYLSTQTGHPAISLAVPFRFGTLVGDLKLTMLQDIIAEVATVGHGYGAVADRAGTTIAHPNRSFVAERLNVSNLNVIQRGLAGKEGTFRFRFRKEAKIGSVAHVPETGWLMVVIQTEQEAFAPVGKVRALLWVSTFLIAALVLVIALVFLRKAMTPIYRLGEMTQRISGGDYLVEKLPKSYPEIDRLTDDFTAMVQAISAREVQLRENEQRTQAILEAAPNPLVVYDPKGIPLFLNPAFTSVFGWTLEELKGKKIPFVPEGQRERTVAKIKALYRDESPGTLETQRLTKNGRILDVLINAALIQGDDGRATGMVVSLMDLTEKKQMETGLMQAQKMEAIGTLAGGVAHDFNNLLMAIQGSTGLILMDLNKDDPLYFQVQGIEQYARQGAALTSQLLGFARGGKYETKPIDLNELIRSHNQTFGRTRKEIRIREQYEKELCPVSANRGQMEQMLMNLYINASGAMPDGGNILVTTRNIMVEDEPGRPFEVTPGKFVQVSVVDTGPGMEAKVRERIFEPFFTTKPLGRGTGLGLASVYGIVKNHHGFIKVQSEIGKGTAFHIFLPAVEGRAAPLEQDQAPKETVFKGEGTILLVDDEEMVREVGRHMLERIGYRVYAAGNAKEALALYEVHMGSVDLVVLDMIMPEMSGKEAFERLMELDPQAKVLLSSGYSIDGQAQTIMDMGCRGFIQKPFSMEELSYKVKEILTSLGGNDNRGRT